MAEFKGKLYGGMLPLAEIFRYGGDLKWTSVGCVDTTPDAVYRRAWNMAAYQGRLFSGTMRMPPNRLLLKGELQCE